MKAIFQEAKATFRLALPIVMGSASQILLGVMDSIMIGRVGTVPLAASALVASIFSFFYVVGIGLLTPVSVLSSRSHGACQNEDCAAWLRHGLGLATAYSGACLLIMGVLCVHLDWFGAPPEVVHEALGFMVLISLSLLPTLIFQALRQYAESMGLPWLPMLVMAGCVLLNLLLNWILIYGNLGSPALGLTGSGIATLSARLLCAAALFALLSRRFRPQGLWPAKGSWLQAWSRAKMGEMLALGIPSAGQLLFEVGAFTAAAIMMGWLGTVALAAHQVALSCITLTFMIPLGVSLASSMRLARAVGAGEHARLRPIAMAGLGSALLSMGTCALFFALFGRWVSGFYSQDPGVRNLAASLLLVASFFQLFDGTQVVAAACLRGLNDVKIPTLVTGAAYWLLAIPVSYLLGVRQGYPQGVWWGLAAGLGFAALFLTLRLLKRVPPIPQPASS